MIRVGAMVGQRVQVGRAGRSGDAAHALVMLRDADMRLMHSLKHGCDCDTVAVKRILQALLDAARAAAARDVAAAQKKAAAHRKRARVANAGKAPKSAPKAKRKRRLKVTAPADVEVGEPEPASARVRPRATGKAVAARGKRAPPAQKAAADSTDVAASSDSESDADTSGSDDEPSAPRPTGASHLCAAGPCAGPIASFTGSGSSDPSAACVNKYHMHVTHLRLTLARLFQNTAASCGHKPHQCWAPS